jgi:hypothetical protein
MFDPGPFAAPDPTASEGAEVPAGASGEPSGPRNFGDVQAEARELADRWEPDASDDEASGAPAPSAPQPSEQITLTRAELEAQHRQYQQAIRQIQEERGVSESVATDLVREMDRALERRTTPTASTSGNSSAPGTLAPGSGRRRNIGKTKPPSRTASSTRRRCSPISLISKDRSESLRTTR